MLTWFSENLINIALVAALALILGLVIRGMVRSRRAGKCSCGSDCGACGGCDKCGPAPKRAGRGAAGASR